MSQPELSNSGNDEETFEEYKRRFEEEWCSLNLEDVADVKLQEPRENVEEDGEYEDEDWVDQSITIPDDELDEGGVDEDYSNESVENFDEQAAAKKSMTFWIQTRDFAICSKL